MSAEAVRTLKLKILYEDQASGPARAFHAAERQRIKDTAKEAERADREYVKAIKARLRAERELADEVVRRIKEREKEQAAEERAYIRAIKAKLKAEAELERQKERAARQAQRDLSNEERAYVKAVRAKLRAEAQLERKKEQAARKAEQAQEKEERDYVKAVRAMLRAEAQLDREKEQTARKAELATAKEEREYVRAIKKKIAAQKELEAEQAQAIKSGQQMGAAAMAAIGAAAMATMKAVAESAQQAREYIKGMTDEMEQARKAAKEIAALRGQSATAGFTANMAREAASAGVDVENYKEFATAWEQEAGQYVGAEGATPEQLAKEGKRIAKDQALELQKRVAGYAMGARGLTAEDSAKALGLVVAKSRAGASNDEIMGNYAKLMKVAELAPGKTAAGLGQITELGMENVGPEGDMKSVLEAAYMYRVMAQRNPAEGATYGRALLRGLREIRMDSKKSAELGIKKGMSVNEQMLAIDEALKRHTAAGGDQGEFLSKYFKDIREWGGAQTYINEGIRGGGFLRSAAEAASVNEVTAAAETNRFKQSQEGRAATDRSEEIAIARERAGKYVELRHIQSEARKAIVTGGEMEIPEAAVGAFLTRTGEAWNLGGRFEQAERAETARMLRERLVSSHEGRQWLIEHNASTAQAARFMPPKTEEAERSMAGVASGMINSSASERLLADAANSLRRIEEHQSKQAAPPLNNAMPMPGPGLRQ